MGKTVVEIIAKSWGKQCKVQYYMSLLLHYWHY